MTINAGLDGMVIFPQVHVIAAANAKLSIGAVNLANPMSGPFQIDTSPRFGRIPLGAFHTTAEVFASDILRLDGRIVVAFPGAGDPPYTLGLDAAFLDPPGTPSPFSPQQYTIPHTAFTLAASVQAALTLPVVGDVPVGNAYFIYEYPGYIAFGGGIPGQSLLGLGQVSGGVSGEVNFTNGRYDIFGNINVCTGIDCPNGILAVSYGGDVNFSDVGMSVCVRPSVFPDFGIGIYWPGRFPTDWHLQGPGCRWSPYADKNVHGSADGPGARAASASLPYTFTVHRRDPGLSIQLAGTGGAPRVRVIAPGGRTIDSPAGDGVVGTQRLMIVRFDRMQITSVGMRHGTPGTYRIVALPGSPPVSQIATATPLPDAKFTASVHGQGTHRVLSYDIAPRPGQHVRFLELTASGAARTIATVTRAGRGSLPFTTAPGTGTRSIVAQCELARLPAERITVAHFRPPSPRLGSIRSLRVDRRGTNIRTSWDAVPGASGYEMVLTTDGSSQRRIRVRGTAVTLRGVARSTAGRVSVRAVDTLREGLPVSAAFTAIASPRTRFRRVPKAPPLR